MTMGDSMGCTYCGAHTWHSGVCPRVKAIEYQPDGRTVKRVELWRVDEWSAGLEGAADIAKAASREFFDAVKKTIDGAGKKP